MASHVQVIQKKILLSKIFRDVYQYQFGYTDTNRGKMFFSHGSYTQLLPKSNERVILGKKHVMVSYRELLGKNGQARDM